MILNQKEQEMFLLKIKDQLSEIDFGHILCNFVVSDKRLMYVDFKQEKCERVYIHSNSNKCLEEKNENS
jgi:hypothetical protein